MAFKLVAVSGLVTLPFCCWAFGRLARFRYPMPELFALAGLCFALDESFSIYGGNLKSTMAGEFSFSIALSLMILGLGLLAARDADRQVPQLGGDRAGAGDRLPRHRGHLHRRSARARHRARQHRRRAAASCYGLGGRRRPSVLLSAFWIGPFVGNHQYMTDMKYGARPDGANDSFWDMFFPLTAPLDILVTALAVVGFVACVARRHANGTALGVIGLLTVALVYLTQDSLPVIGLLWNPRLLPLLYLVRYLLMMVGIVEIVGLGRQRVARPPGRDVAGWIAGSATVGGVGARRAASCSASCSRCCPATAAGCSTTRPSRSTPGVRSARRRPAATPRATAGRATTSSATRAARSTPSTTTSCRRWPTSARPTAAAGSRGRTTRTTASTARRWR